MVNIHMFEETDKSYLPEGTMIIDIIWMYKKKTTVTLHVWLNARGTKQIPEKHYDTYSIDKWDGHLHCDYNHVSFRIDGISGVCQGSFLTWRILKWGKNLYQGRTMLGRSLLIQFCLKIASMHLWFQASRDGFLLKASQMHEEYSYEVKLCQSMFVSQLDQ